MTPNNSKGLHGRILIDSELFHRSYQKNDETHGWQTVFDFLDFKVGKLNLI